jgi:hypothetical protein
VHPIQKKMPSIERVQQDSTHFQRRITRTWEHGQPQLFEAGARGMADILHKPVQACRDQVATYNVQVLGMSQSAVEKLSSSYWRKRVPTEIPDVEDGWNSHGR